MSTIKIDNFVARTEQLNGNTSTVTAATIVNGVPKSWVNFNGTGTIATRASFNVASLTDNGVADYSVNFSNAFTDANYSYTTATGVGGCFACIVNQNGSGTEVAPTTSSCRMETQNNTQFLDQKYIHVIVCR